MTDPTSPTPAEAALPPVDPGNPLVFNYLNRQVAVSVTPVQPPGAPVWLLALTFRDVTTTYTHWLDEALAQTRIAQLKQGITELRGKSSGGLIVPPSGFNLGAPGVNGVRRTR